MTQENRKIPEELVVYDFDIPWSEQEKHLKKVYDFLKSTGMGWVYNYFPPAFIVKFEKELDEKQLEELEKVIKEFLHALVDNLKLKVWKKPITQHH